MPKKSGEGEMHSIKKGQSWSIDLIIAVIVFMLIIAVFYALISSRGDSGIDALEQDADTAKSKITSHDTLGTVNFIQDGEIDGEKLRLMCDTMSYEDIRAQLGIENDFCLYLEDPNGNLIPCGLSNKAGIGNMQDINISGTIRCGVPLP